MEGSWDSHRHLQAVGPEPEAALPLWCAPASVALTPTVFPPREVEAGTAGSSRAESSL